MALVIQLCLIFKYLKHYKPFFPFLWYCIETLVLYPVIFSWFHPLQKCSHHSVLHKSIIFRSILQLFHIVNLFCNVCAMPAILKFPAESIMVYLLHPMLIFNVIRCDIFLNAALNRPLVWLPVWLCFTGNWFQNALFQLTLHLFVRI